MHHFFRMEKPAQCSMDIYMLMRKCWQFYPNQRPTFQEIVEKLQQILETSGEEEYLDLGLPSPDTPTSSLDGFRYETRPFHVDNNNYDHDQQMSPDQGFVSGSGGVLFPAESLSLGRPLTYTALAPSFRTPMAQSSKETSSGYLDPQRPFYSHHTSLPLQGEQHKTKYHLVMEDNEQERKKRMNKSFLRNCSKMQ